MMIFGLGENFVTDTTILLASSMPFAWLATNYYSVLAINMITKALTVPRFLIGAIDFSQAHSFNFLGGR